MSISSSTTPALRVEIRPSNYFRAGLLVLALLAFTALSYSELTLQLHLLLAGATLGYAVYCWRTQRRQRGELQWRSTWRWHDAAGERSLQLQRCTVWPGLIVLVFSETQRRKKWVFTLLPDSFAHADDARRLRAHLLHFPVFEVTSGD